MKYFFNIAKIGICIEGIRDKKLDEKNLIPFIITSEEFNALEENVRILVKEVSNEALEKSISDNCEDGMTSASFGHKRFAVLYNCENWRAREILIYLNEDCYNESAWNLNQFISIIGIHSLFLHRSSMILHASFIIYNNEAILFTAPSQTGKSTQAKLWKGHEDAEIINEDRVLVCKQDDEWYACGVPMCGSSDCSKNERAKIKSIIVLDQGINNTIVHMSKLQKYKALLLGCQYHLWNKEENQLIHDLIKGMIEDLEIVTYICKPDITAVDYLKHYMEGRRDNEY